MIINIYFRSTAVFLAKTGVHKILKPDHNTCQFAFIMDSYIIKLENQ